jgi:hypothetical protein
MYAILLLGLLGLGVFLLARGIVARRPPRIALGAGVIAATLLFFAFMSLWGEALWFGAVGYSARFWTVFWTQVLCAAGGAVLAAAVVRFLTRPVEARLVPRLATLVAGVLGALFGLATWQRILLFLNGEPTGVADPILGKDTGFYLFRLPVYDRLYGLLLLASVVGLVAALLSWVTLPKRKRPPFPIASFVRGSAVLGVVLAWGRILARYHLLYSKWGVVAGAGWTDVHVRLPAYWFAAVAVLGLGFVPYFLRKKQGTLRGVPMQLLQVLGCWAVAMALWLLSLGIVPALVHWLVVVPNEITFEKPYIANNIRFTRRGFKLHTVEERQFPATGEFTPETARRNEHLLSDVRLWDWRALDAVYKQFQEIRLYYEFLDVDIDRYEVDGRYRQVMVSARELKQTNLPPQSRTFVNERFKYTHGYGLTLAAVNEFTPDGLPNLLVKDIPPASTAPELRVDRPQIYYGQATRGPAVVNTSEKEFDHPSGDANEYIQYPGKGGVELTGLWRKFLFGWKFDGTRFLFSGYPRAGSRVQFHRQIDERVRTLAPFLRFEDDPYIVLVDGRLYWIVDAYTTSTYYPYSEPFRSRESIEYKEGNRTRTIERSVAPQLDRANYVRNSVKVVVDAFDGTVDFYVFEPDDPLIRAWRGAFPKLFKDADAMPEALRRHVRYPEGLLLAQGLVYAKYHMENPEVFYNQEDLWVRATEKYYSQVQPVEPYYVMWQQPDAERAEFVLIQPFTPKNRQVLIGWIAGMCDGENYGRFLAYKFPKERRVLGPQQVETKIDQDRFLSGQLTLWDQRGSNVIRGNVLAIPIEGTILYVEPIYLQAETAAYPELRLVVVMHGDTMSYAETFEKALAGLFEGGARELPPDETEERAPRELARAANDAFERYLELQGAGKFEEAAKELTRLRELLEKLAEED